MSLYQIALCRQQRISKSFVCLFYVLNNFYVAFQRHCCKMMLPNSALFPASILRCLQERHTVRLLVQGNMGCWCISVHPVSMLGIWCSSCHAHSDRPFGCESAHVCVCVCAHACVQDRCSTWLVRSLLIRYVCVRACVHRECCESGDFSLLPIRVRGLIVVAPCSHFEVGVVPSCFILFSWLHLWACSIGHARSTGKNHV